MQETANTQMTMTDQESAAHETRLKKQWIKPEARELNINSGGGIMPDGPDTRATFTS